MPELRIVVLVKQVPDTANVTGEAMKEDGTINRAALPAVFNPEDLNALEEALKLKDRLDARVTVVTMGPPAATQVLRESLYRGADEVILLTDKAFAGADTLATSYRRRHGAGRPADGGEARLPADHLRQPHRLARGAGGRRDPHRRDHRHTQHRGRLRDAHQPAAVPAHRHRRGQRPASPERQDKGIDAEAMPDYDDSYLDPERDEAEVCMVGRDGKPVCRARVVQWDHESLAADREALGLRGSPTRVKEIESVVLAQSEARMVAPDEAGIAELVHELIEEHILG